MMSLGMLLIPLGDTAGKLMTSTGIAPFFVAWSRYLVGLLVLLPFALHKDAFGLLKNWRIWVRSAIQAITITTILTALKTEPIANVFAAFFLGPMVSYILSVTLLKEVPSTLRLILLAIGLIGVFLVVKPGFGMTTGLAWAAFSGICYGVFLTASRWVSPYGKPVHLMMTQLFIGALLLTPLGLLNLPTVTPAVSGLVLWSGVASMFGNLLLIFAYARAGASVLAPFVYVQLIGATAYGWLVFGNLPDGLSTLGLVVIFLSGFATLFIPKSKRPTL
ncbi:EamA-like transporter family protein [Litoreibacter albidus]|uniref:EamA-like transporter family protein n=2 Tax=Litoreibacter albidus TaxID=670155 RepID=A0A1H3AAR5_9RHOB|nr:EamA-like transporter family protein [Litoreibacter albidus]